MSRSSRPEVFCKKCVLRNFAKFTGKHLRQSLFFNTLPPAIILKKRLWHRCFPVNFAKFQRTPFLQNTSERLLLYVSKCKFSQAALKSDYHVVKDFCQIKIFLILVRKNTNIRLFDIPK